VIFTFIRAIRAVRIWSNPYAGASRTGRAASSISAAAAIKRVHRESLTCPQLEDSFHAGPNQCVMGHEPQIALMSYHRHTRRGVGTNDDLVIDR
jgi:hypothetical protein